MKKNFTILLALTMVLISFVLYLSSCQRSESKQKTGSWVEIKGSDTMVHLVSAWAEEFMKENPGKEISVTGGGSGTGIAALLNETTDICAASRELKEKEEKLAQEKGISPIRTEVAKDGIAVIVNQKNPVNALTLEQLQKIFTGASTNWKQFGGPDQEIVILSRESNSGTYVFFQERVLNKKDYAPSAKLMPATSSIVQSVSSSEGAIGYAGLGYALEAEGKVKILLVKKDSSSPEVSPSLKTVQDGTYPISRPLQLYTKGDPPGTVKEFIDFSLSPAGQKIVKETGYIPIREF